MNTKEYIESGILEAYVIDALTPEEALEVRANIARYPELAAEVKAIEEGMLAFAQADALAPPEGLKEQIWNFINADDAVVPGVDQINKSRSETRPFISDRHQLVYWQRAAVWIALIGSLVANYLLWSKYNTSDQEQLVLTSQVDSLSRENGRLARLEENVRRESEMVADTAMHSVVMKTLVPGRVMAATVYWSRSNGDIYLAVQKLPPPPAGKQYQMWVIQDGTPVSMGVIPNEVVIAGMITKLPAKIMNAQAFAISLEKEGGNAAPTEVQVLGKPS